MPQHLFSSHERRPARITAIRCTDLPPQANRLLWLSRLFIAARLDYARAERSIALVAPRCSRAVPILLCHLLLEISRHATRRVQVASPCHGTVVEDELRFLAAVDLAQLDDPRLPCLLQETYGPDCDADAIAPVLTATLKLGEALLQEGMRVEACHLLPEGALPTLH
ncbi:hypothetical protein [Pedomonas mirosovicensis]|uniref:hypothetical protein n=1 Tax=Pedomonas mirosovicensis TaxID=2908641 RepID=UPI002169D170|nr:hypothetical protein [Pedomonas mirosovicensis]MCH8685118.1 hypothetical protein [Pedomonas mirosovicensis]